MRRRQPFSGAGLYDVRALQNPQPMRPARAGQIGELRPQDTPPGMSPIEGVVFGIAANVEKLARVGILKSGFFARSVTLAASTPARIIVAKEARGYTLFNPSTPVGLTIDGTVLASALRVAGASGNTQATPIQVANYKNLSLFLNISAVVGAADVTINAQTRNPLTLGWAGSVSDIFNTVAGATGEFYARLGELGIEENFAISWSVAGGVSATFSVAFVAKDGLSGSGAGASQAIFLNSSDAVTVGNGIPIIEGASRDLFVEANVEVWAVSAAPVTLRVFETR